MLVSFDELVLQCIDENSRTHIREAVRCYEAGAYRAAIVAAYIAVCFDLIEKLRSLAASGDAEAKLRTLDLQKLQNKQVKGDPSAIGGLLKFERDLLTMFRDKFEFFGTIEFDDMSRLTTDRNRCAHPTFLQSEEPYRPSAENARLHIRNAISMVLSQEPKQGKAALANLQAIITSEYFPTAGDEVLSRLKASPLSAGRAAMLRAFVDDAVFGIVDKDHPYYKSMAAVRALEAVREMHTAVVAPRLTSNIEKLLLSSDKLAVRYASVIALRSPEIGSGVGEAAYPAVRTFVKNPAGSKKVNALSSGLKVEWLKPFAIDEIAKLGSGELKGSRLPPEPEVVARAVTLIKSVKSYDIALQVAEDVLHLVPYFTEAEFKEIIQAAADNTADLKGAFGFESILKAGALPSSRTGKSKLKKLLSAAGLNEPKWLDDEVAA